MFWTHNDSGTKPELFAFGLDGVIKARVAITGISVDDWEDIEAGMCGDGHCLYIADIGDNEGKRKSITIYEVQEPLLPASSATVSRVIHARYPDGAQDAEALFRLPSAELYVVTKGRQQSIKLYRLAAKTAQSHATLELVREIARPGSPADWVTAATASPNGNWVAIRTYTTLHIYRTEELLRVSGTPAITFALSALGEKQGESITLDDDGNIWVTSEARVKPNLPTFGQIRCTLDP